MFIIKSSCIVWRGSGAAGSWDPWKHRHPGKHQFSRSRCASHLNEWPNTSGTVSSGWGPGCHYRSGTVEVHHSPDLTWGQCAPGGHRWCQSARLVHSPGPVHSWCMAHRVVVCRPEETCCKNGWCTSERLTYVPALSGKDVSVARAFPGPPLLRWPPFAGPLLGRSCMLPGWLHTCCLQKVAYQEDNAVLVGLFHGLSSEHIASTAHLSRGMGELNNPLKTLQGHDLAGTERQRILWWTRDWPQGQQRQRVGSDSLFLLGQWCCYHVRLMRSLWPTSKSRNVAGFTRAHSWITDCCCCCPHEPCPMLLGMMPGSSAEPGVLELATVVTVKQATMELEHRGSV